MFLMLRRIHIQLLTGDYKFRIEIIMKKVLILIIASLCVFDFAGAQSWADALKKVATEAADKATGGKVTEAALHATWTYSQPALRLSSDAENASITDVLKDIGSNVAGSALIGDKMKKAFKSVGIKEGFCTITFSNDGTFAMPVKGKEIKGTYTYDASSHSLTLKVMNKISVTGYAFISGTELQMVFSMEKLISFVSALGSSISNNATLASISKMLNEYKEAKFGLQFKK